MKAYYNDSDPFVCQWLRNLIAAGHLPAGEVDERPIQEVRTDDVRRFTQCHFFAGIGGWAYALELAGWGDRPVWTGSCPCQPGSAAGKRAGHRDPRHLWPAWHQLIAWCRPDTIFGEQVSGFVGLGWLDAVSADLEAEGYAVGAVVLGAHSVGAPHLRQRLYFVADTGRIGRQSDGLDLGATASDCSGASQEQRLRPDPWASCEFIPCRDGKARPVEPGTFPLAHGIPARVGRLRAYGNSIVPQVAAAFVRAYLECAP